MQWVVVTQWGRTSGSRPTCPKPRQPVRSKLHVHTQPWTYGAGGSEEAGRVREPRHEESRGHTHRSPEGTERNADGFHGPEGRRPECARARGQDTTGV